jgi:hypothetical protein
MGRCTPRNSEQVRNSDGENLTGKEKVQGRGLGRGQGKGLGRGLGRVLGRNRRNWE